MGVTEKELSIDFAALRTLRYVFELRSFSRAAEKLGQTQSNVSYTVSRLRECFQDPLFVREGTGMAPTERCRSIVLKTSAMLEEYQAIVSQTDFVPATASGTVTVSCNHYERLTILPSLIRNLRENAPGVQLRVINSHGRGEEQLKRGECDILIGPMQFVGEAVYKRHLWTDRYCCVMDAQNALSQSRIEAEDFRKTRHVVVQFPGGWRTPYIEKFEAQGINLRILVALSEYGDIGGYVKGTDLIAIMPVRIAEKLGDQLVQKKLPIPASVEIDLFWTARTHQSPLHKWIRSAIASV